MDWFEVKDFIALLSSIFGLIGGIVMVVSGIQFFRLRRLLKKKMKELMQPKADAEMVINLSGHPMKLSQNDWLVGKHVIDVPVGNISDISSLEEEASTILSMLDKGTVKDMSYGMPIVFALPGMSSLTQLLVPKLHAIIGKFPIVTYAMTTSDGWVWQEPIDLQIVRTNTRLARPIFSSLD